MAVAPILNTHNISVTLTTNTNNYLKTIKLGALILNREGFSPQIALFQNQLEVVNNYTNNFNVPTEVFGGVFSLRCFYGFSRKLTFNYDGTEFKSHLYRNGVSGNYTFPAYLQLNVVELDIIALCLGQCPASTFPGNPTHSCQQCSDIHPTCLACNSSAYCQSCSQIDQVSLDIALCSSCNSYLSNCQNYSSSCACKNCYSVTEDNGCFLCRDLL